MFTIDFEPYEFQSEFEYLDEALNTMYPYGDVDVTPDDKFDELCRKVLLDAPAHDELLSEAIANTGLDKTFPEIVEADIAQLEQYHDGKVYYIMSVVGDDEHTTTNSVAFALLCIVTAVYLSRIKLSWKDVGISNLVGNYAEGWLVLPPTAEASFEAVNRRSQRSGVPFTLDPVKLKFLSPVRKQSEMEQDLESKFEKLATISEWADPSWFTYDYHQMAKILATVVFDYSSAKTFPYLYATEGGCGGCPPYNNIDTAISGLFKYTRGKSIRAIVGVMTETGLIHAGEMSPKDSFFLKSSHIAQMGDKAWVEFTTAYRALLDRQGLTRSEARNLVHSLRGSQLPQEYLDIATEVEPDDATIGVAISHLREEGYLLTELDVKMLLNKREKEKAVFGRKPMSKVIEDLDAESALFKANHWKVLTELSLNDPHIRSLTESMLGENLDSNHASVWKVMHRYYRIRTESGSRFSSFMYSDSIKVFRTEDVLRLTNRGSSSLRQDFTHTEGMEKLWRSFEADTIAQAEKRERIVNWLHSDSLKELLSQPLPDGIGPDDARIYRSFSLSLDDEEITEKPVIFLIVTSDKGLTRVTNRLVSNRVRQIQLKHPSWVAISFVITREDYIALCLAAVQEISELRQPGDSLYVAKCRLTNQERGRRIAYYNYLMGEIWYYPLAISDQIASNFRSWRDRARPLAHQFRVITEYDYPNLERGFESLSYNSVQNVVMRRSGGYLSRQSVESFPAQLSWAGLPVDQLYRWPDFDMSTTRAYRPMVHRNGGQQLIPDNHIRVHKVQGVSLYDRVDAWRHR
jgi:hypothetical protein